MSVLHAADLYKLQVRAGAMQPRRRHLASYPLLAAVGLASVVVLYQMRHVARQQLELERAGGAGRDLPAGCEGAGEPAGEQQRRAPAQEQRLAVLLPCWADCPQASILVVYLSGLLRQQGVARGGGQHAHARWQGPAVARRRPAAKWPLRSHH